MTSTGFAITLLGARDWRIDRAPKTRSLIRRGSGNLNSLIHDQNSVFRSLGNSPEKPNGHAGFHPGGRRNRPEKAKFPVFTLLIGELLDGDRFASDCVIRQRVSGLRHSPGKSANYARVGAMRTGHRHRITRPRRENRSDAARLAMCALSGADARATECSARSSANAIRAGSRCAG